MRRQEVIDSRAALPAMGGTLVAVGVLAFALVACTHKHPETQMFRRPGWRLYMGLPSSGLDYGGNIGIRGAARDSVAIEVNARNHSTDSIDVQISSMCTRGVEPNFTVRVYGSRHGLLRRRGQPVWTLDAWREAKWRQAEAKRVRKPPINGLEEVIVPTCAGVSYSLRFSRGDTRSLGARAIAIRDVLGDSLPPGRYVVSAQIRGNGFTYVAETRLGDIELREPSR